MQGALLAALACERKKVISDDRIITLLWDENPPGAAFTTLRSHVMRLNRMLSLDENKIFIRRSGGGYMLDCPDGKVDIESFATEIYLGRSLLMEGNPAGALAHLENALQMWAGAPFSGISQHGWVYHETQKLEGLRLTAVQVRIEVFFGLERYDAAIAELRRLISNSPNDERLHAQLALAMYRNHQVDQALEACRAGIRLLNDAGLDPRELRNLQSNILNRAPELAPVASHSEHQPPRGLPPDIADFTGRHSEIDRLRSLIMDSDRPGSRRLVISAIAGTGGVGKTALAIHLGHLLTTGFPDGQLYVNLHGYDARQMLGPDQVLDEFLRALGVSDQAIPKERAERISLYRSLLTGRKVLIILDNASSADQIRELFPNTNSCVTLITSRDTLGSVVVDDGAYMISLDVLGKSEAADLLMKTMLRQVSQGEEVYVDEIVDLCGCLPLAVRIAGAKILARPGMTLETFAGLLRDERYRLEVLNVGDIGVRASFSLSYNSLAPQQQRIFRLLGLVAGPDFSIEAVSALADQPVSGVRRIIDRLIDAHLLNTNRDGSRFRFHDLLRLYSRECLAEEEDPGEQTAAIRRLLHWYRCVTDAASNNVMRTQRMPREYQSADLIVDISTRSLSLQWLEIERQSIVAAIGQAFEHSLLDFCWELADGQWGFFYLRKHWTDWEISHQKGLQAARRARSPEAESWILTNLGVCYWDQHQARKAIGCFSDALVIARQHGYETCEARDINGLALSHRDLEMWPEALEYAQAGIPRRRSAGDRWGEAVSLDNTGLILGKLSRLGQSIDTFEQALLIWQEIGDGWGHALTLNDMARTLTEGGQPERALPRFRQAITIRRDIGDVWGEGESLYYLGMALKEVEGPDSARRCWLAALKIMTDLNAAEAVDVRARLSELSAD
jgi:DNA-binding SARP family transcriptional activator